VFRPADATIQMVLWSGLAIFLRGLIIQLRQQREELRRIGEQADRSARRDPLTGLRNRRSFDEDAELEVARHQRTGSLLGLVVLDLDYLKQINDRHGHMVGDEALCAVAAALKQETRAVDGCYRWGGDEFAMLLPTADRRAAEAVCERVADRLGNGSMTLPDGRHVRISWGLAEIDGSMSVDDAVTAADSELLAAKRARGARSEVT
jgi:diguanylate cyclase (GGDEF)-like protein